MNYPEKACLTKWAIDIKMTIIETARQNASGTVKATKSDQKEWKLLIDRKMSKGELGKLAGISPNTMTKLRRDEIVALPILDKICDTLDVDYGDIIEHVKEEQVTAQ